MRSHRTHGRLMLESGSVSNGKATPYLPVIELLKSYFRIQDRDGQPELKDATRIALVVRVGRTFKNTIGAEGGGL